MTINIKTRYVILGILIAFLGSFLLGGHLARKRENNALNATIQTLLSVNKNYSYEIDGLTKEASEKNQMILSQKEAINLGLVQKEELKKLNLKLTSELTLIKAQVNVLLDSISNTGQVIIIQPYDSIESPKPAMLLPFTFQEKNKYLNLVGAFDINGKMNLSLDIPLSVSVFTGLDKKTRQYKAVVTTDNPYFKTIDISSIKMDIPKVSRGGIGLVIGYGVALKKEPQLTPVVGVGYYRTILRF